MFDVIQRTRNNCDFNCSYCYSVTFALSGKKKIKNIDEAFLKLFYLVLLSPAPPPYVIMFLHVDGSCSQTNTMTHNHTDRSHTIGHNNGLHVYGLFVCGCICAVLCVLKYNPCIDMFYYFSF